MAPPKSAPRKPRAKQNGDAAAKAESAKTGGGDTGALDEVQLYEKTDIAAPESPVLPKTDAVNESPRDPKPVTVEAGDTVAAHESHVLGSTREKISERIEKESGPKGLPADVVAREQFYAGRAIEEGRVDVVGSRYGEIGRGVADSSRPKRGGDAA